MKYLKYLFLTIFSLIILSLLAVIYDLSYYDPSYVNRNAITFSKKNINSKKIRKIYSSLEKIPYILGNQFLDSHKRFWEVEDENKRNSLPSTIVIPAKKENFKKGTEIENIERNYSNWTRSHGGYSNLRFSNLDLINRSNVKD